MSNSNTTERGVKVGKAYRCFKLFYGENQKGSWGFFTWIDKDENKKPLQKYNIFIENKEIIPNFPLDRAVDVRIEKIMSIKPSTNSYTSNGQKITERIITVNCECSIIDYGYQQPSATNTQPTETYQQPQYDGQEPQVDNIVNDFDFPF